MLTQSEHIDQLATALADVQALIDGVLKESPNSVYGSRYAELSKVWEAFQRVGPDHGLSVVQLPGQFNAEARTMSMSVRLMHSSGQWLGGEMKNKIRLTVEEGLANGSGIPDVAFLPIDARS